MDTIDDLILYLENEEEYILDFKIEILMLISLMITRLNSKLFLIVYIFLLLWDQRICGPGPLSIRA